MKFDAVQLLVGLVLVSVIYHAWVFYLTLFRKLIGRLLRSGAPKQATRSLTSPPTSHPTSHPRGPNLWLVLLTLGCLMASGFFQSLRIEDIRRERHAAKGVDRP